MNTADDQYQLSRKERALAWYAIHADELVDTWLAELWPLSPNVESKSRFHRRLSELRDVFIHAISAEESNAPFERSQGIVFATTFGGNLEALTIARTVITRTMLTELPPAYLPAVVRPFERAMTHFSWGFGDHVTAVERREEGDAAVHGRPDPEIDDHWYREILEQSPFAVAIFRASDRYFAAGNAALVELLGYELSEFGDVPDDAVLSDASTEHEVDKAHELALGKIPYLVRDQIFRHKDGHLVPFRSHQWYLTDANGEKKYLVTEMRQPNEQETAWQRAEKRFRHLAQLSVDPTFVVDHSGKITYASPATQRGLGNDPEALTGRHFMELVLLSDHKAFTEFRRALEEWPRTLRTIELRLYRSDGQWRWFEVTGVNLFDVPEIEGISLQARDVTDRKRVEEWLSQQALIDPLTNLLNRRGVMAQLELVLERSRSSGQTAGILFIDLDRFHAINNRFGHEVGDAMLVELAERLRFVLGGASSAARLGGDEFVVVLENTSLEQITALADQVAAALGSAVEIGSNVHRVRANIGIVTSEGGRDSSTELLRNADAAQYRAKASGMPVLHSDGDR